MSPRLVDTVDMDNYPRVVGPSLGLSITVTTMDECWAEINCTPCDTRAITVGTLLTHTPDNP